MLSNSLNMDPVNPNNKWSGKIWQWISGTIIVTGITLDHGRKHMPGTVSVTKNPGLGNSWPPGTDLPPLF